MRLIDVTLPLSEHLPRYPGDPPFVRWRYRTIDDGPYEVSQFSFGAHSGTHVDAPRHFIEGANDVASLALELLCGSARVLDLRESEPAISAAELRKVDLDGVQRLLFRTLPGRDLEHELMSPGAYLTPDAARYLIDEADVRLVGIDRLSIDSDDVRDFPVHHLLLGAEVVLVEGLDLRRVSAGDYTLWCLPLRIPDADAAPARVLLQRP
jgi:arylformamidase